MKRWLLPWWTVFAVALTVTWMACMYGWSNSDSVLPRFGLVVAGWWSHVGIPWLVALVTLGAGYIIGEWIYGKFAGDLRNLNPILSTALGLGVITFTVYLLGLAQALWWPVIVAGVLWVYWWGYRSVQRLSHALTRSVRSILSWHWTEKTLLAVIVWYICRTLPSVTNPATGWDECNSHLVLPSLYVSEHSIQFYEWVNFSNFPPFLHMLLVIQRMFTGTPGAVWPYLFHLGTLAVIWMLVRDVMRNQVIGTHYWTLTPDKNSHIKHYGFGWLGSALFAILLYLMIPITTLHSQAVLTDPVLVFYCTLLLWMFVNHENYPPWLIGLITGIVVSIKYTGIIWCGVLVLITLYFQKFVREKVIDWKAFEIYSGVALLYCLPWMVRNIVLFGDPIFPTLHLPFTWGIVPAETQSQLAVNYWSMLDYFRTWNLSWMHFLGLVDPAPWVGLNPRPDETGPVLLVTVPLIAFVWRSLSRGGKVAVVVGLAYVAVWILVVGILHTRYMWAAYPVLCAGAGVAITKLLEDWS